MIASNARALALIGVIACGARTERTVDPIATAPTASAAPIASAHAGARRGVRHEIATDLAKAIDAGDAAGAARTFASDGVFVRLYGKDAHGPAAIEPVFRQAFGLCKMRVAAVLEREASFYVQVASECTHPDFSGHQNHLLIADAVGDRITRASLSTDVSGRALDRPLVREREDPESLTRERSQRATCEIDEERRLLPADFGDNETDVWMTPTCTVLTVRPKSKRPSGYVQIECKPRGPSCRSTDDMRRYFDWNGFRLAPFADPDQVYVSKPRP